MGNNRYKRVRIVAWGGISFGILNFALAFAWGFAQMIPALFATVISVLVLLETRPRDQSHDEG